MNISDHHRTVAAMPRLTIVMPLKGRRLFTFRFLRYADALRMPYRFIVADGQVNEAAARHLENSRETFPNLDIEYIRYPDDTGFGQIGRASCRERV